MCIPDEMDRFLRREGVVLLIRGRPGTGKTTLSLELMSRYNLAYVGTSKSIREILKTHPWVTGDMRRMMFGVDEAYDFRDTEKFGNMFYLIPEALRHVLNLYEDGEIEGIIVDSWHSIINELNVKAMEERERSELYDSSSLFLKLLRFADLGVKFVIVKEGEEDDELTYLADGLVTMYRKVEDGRIYRWMLLEKLRGEEITKNRYFYTLQGSRFSHLVSRELAHPPKVIGFSREDGNGTLGCTYFHDVFTVKRGNVVVFDYGEYIPKSYKLVPLMGFVANHISSGGRAIIIPSNDLDIGELKYYVYLFGLEKHYNNIRYLYGSEVYEEISKKVNLSKPMEIINAVAEEMPEEASEMPPLVIVGYDRLYSYLSPREIMQVLYRIKDIVREKGGIMLIAGNITDREIKRFCSSISEIYVKFHNIAGDILMYGIKPWSRLYHLSLEYNRYPEVVKRVIA